MVPDTINKFCDRCRKRYEGYRIKSWHVVMGLDRIDLCPDCRKSLENWLFMKGEKENG